MAGVDEQHLEPAGLEDLKERDPIDPGRFHRDGGHRTALEPVGQGMQISGEGAETAHRLCIAARRHGHPMLGGTDVDAGGMKVDPAQALRQGSGAGFVPRFGFPFLWVHGFDGR
jgi:hypothetical protein